MSKNKITIQDIADSLSLSRNTVSKALNGNESIPETTRNKVIEKAIQLKYKQFAVAGREKIAVKNTNNIALLTHHMPDKSHFGSLLISGLEKKFSDEGYNLSIHILREAEIDNTVLPNNFETKNVGGIVCIELFDKKYTEFISSLGIPAIFIDSLADVFYLDLNADLILMENEHSTYLMTKELIKNGCTDIGFIGDYNHCKSFNERWIGFNRALSDSSLPLDMSYCIIEKDQFQYVNFEFIKTKLDNMKKLPCAFVCANDFIAISAIQILKAKNVKIPEEVAVSGFDDSPEASIFDPKLTTARIFNNEMGIIAAEMLLARMRNPSMPFQITHVKTQPVFRESTEKFKKHNL